MEKCFRGHSLSDPGIFDDPYLLPYYDTIALRLSHARELESALIKKGRGSLKAFAGYDKTLGFHFEIENDAWVLREWAPHADEIFIVCDKTSWQKSREFQLERKENDIFEKYFPKDTFSHGDLYRLKITWPGGEGDRIPTAATRVVQDPRSLIFNAQVWEPQPPYLWKLDRFIPETSPLLIYEVHVGMALEEGRICSYDEFERHILPKIVDAGYNTIQMMAIQEHPYYASFGYHVSSFFAPSSRFGTPDDLKSLIDAAHLKGIRVLMDIIHSHAVKNETEGISKFDGSAYQFFHDGPKGYHRQWDSRCFNYGKTGVLRFLLSNIRYWIEEFKIDGFRFDGITSMLFEDHGLGRAFTRYEDYFGKDVDVDALSYLTLANKLAHDINPGIITIAEDVSGYPGLAAPISKGGAGFDYRYAMGIADFWIKLVKDVKDEQWHLGKLWYELTTKRKEEKTISYAESHDQALVGDKTLMMHLMGEKVYTSMSKSIQSPDVLRGISLHKMIRLITISTADSGYLNFMGNEFGHPEWVDFPSERNGFSYHHARRQWSLKYDQRLYYSSLFEFDKQMIDFMKNENPFQSVPRLLLIHEDDRIIAFERNNTIFVYNFNPEKSFTDYKFDAPPGEYQMVLNTDEIRFGGKGRLRDGQVHFTLFNPLLCEKRNLLSLYLPNRTAVVLKKSL